MKRLVGNSYHTLVFFKTSKTKYLLPYKLVFDKSYHVTFSFKTGPSNHGFHLFILKNLHRFSNFLALLSPFLPFSTFSHSNFSTLNLLSSVLFLLLFGKHRPKELKCTELIFPKHTLGTTKLPE